MCPGLSDVEPTESIQHAQSVILPICANGIYIDTVCGKKIVVRARGPRRAAGAAPGARPVRARPPRARRPPRGARGGAPEM